MATNAVIAVKTSTGIYRTVTVNWDGDRLTLPLVEFYNDIDLARELVSMGNISDLGKRIHPIGPHSFDKPEKGTTIFYSRDRKEPLRSNFFSTQKEVTNWTFGNGIHYVYIFNGKKWILKVNN